MRITENGLEVCEKHFLPLWKKALMVYTKNGLASGLGLVMLTIALCDDILGFMVKIASLFYRAFKHFL